ncbi:hypothetical protein SAMN05446935_8396 [Burkholderia sp. YR290]|nr:hypothetical protein SAMN05446935_8396 [Burkholderia sp. YR290]
MHHARFSKWMAAARGPRLRLKAAVVVCAFFGGCGTYLHDDALQKKTDKLLSDYKAADIKDALASAVAAQQALDASAVQDVIARNNAARDATLAPLMLQQAKGTPIDNLRDYINKSEAQLAGGTYTIDKFDAIAVEQDLRIYWAQLQSKKLQVSQAFGVYVQKGGKAEPSCPLKQPSGEDAKLADIAQRITNLCGDQDTIQTQIDDRRAKVNELSGSIAKAQVWAAQMESRASAAHAAEDAQTKKLADLKNAVLAAASGASAASAPAALAPGAAAAVAPNAQEQAASDASAPAVAAAAPASKASQAAAANAVKEWPNALKDLADGLNVADQAAGMFGLKSPGTALATVKFRSTNLCEVIAAEAGQSCSGATPTAAASDVTAAIANISAGLAGLATPPDPGVTSVALAYQSAVGKVAQGQLSILDQQAALGQDRVQHLLLELGYLQIAQTKVLEAKAATPSAQCATAGLASALTDRTLGCSTQYREAVAQALVAVNQSFAVGQAVASVDLVKTGKLEYMARLQGAQQVANARDSVLMIVVNEIDAYGQGGVAPATIAAFLQAFGIVAIAAK